MSDVASGISAAVEEQGIATREIVRNVDQAATGNPFGDRTHLRRGQDRRRDRRRRRTGAGAAPALTDQGRQLEQQMRRFLETVRAA